MPGGCIELFESSILGTACLCAVVCAQRVLDALAAQPCVLLLGFAVVQFPWCCCTPAAASGFGACLNCGVSCTVCLPASLLIRYGGLLGRLTVNDML